MNENIRKLYHEARGYGCTAKQALYQAKLGASLRTYFTHADETVELPGGYTLTCKVEWDEDGGQPWEDDCFGVPEAKPAFYLQRAPRKETAQARNERILRGEKYKRPPMDDSGAGGWVHLTGEWYYPQRDALAKARKEGCDWQAVKSERELFSRWLRDDWHYVGVIVTLLDRNGREIERESCWHIDDADYAVREVGNELARELVDAFMDKRREQWRGELRAQRKRKREQDEFIRNM